MIPVNNNLLIRSGTWTRTRRRRMMSCFSSSPFDALTTTTATDTALIDDVEAPAKDGSKEEAANV